MIVILIAAALAGSEITLLEQAAVTGSKFRFLSGGGMYILNIIIVLVTGLPIYVSEEWKEIMNVKVLSQQYQLLQLEQQHTVFELELLRAKVNPHFLYNVHNSIAGLITKDPGKAEKMVLLLSRFFRLTLNKSSATFHSVADEIEIIRTYLELQHIRYGNQLHYHINANKALLHLQMPSFLLQPLVENAVKHGIERSAENGFAGPRFSGYSNAGIYRI